MPINQDDVRRLNDAAAAATDFYDLWDIVSGAIEFDQKDKESLMRGFKLNWGQLSAEQKAELRDFDVTLWSAVYADSTALVVRARLAHSLWDARAAGAIRYARAAIDIYLELANTWTDLASAECCQEAVQLALSIRDDVSVERALALAVAFAGETMQDARPPGVVFGFFRALFLAPRSKRPNEVADLLSQARRFYADDPWHSEEVIALQFQMVAGDGKATMKLMRERVELWEHAAQAERGLRRLIYFDRALASARDIPDLRDRVAQQRQLIRPRDLGLQRRTVQIEVDALAAGHFARQCLEVTTWQGAVDRLLAAEAPSGRNDRNQADATRLAAGRVLDLIAETTVLDKDGNTVRREMSGDERADETLGELELGNSNFHAIFAAVPVLQTLPVRYEGLSQTTLAAYLTSMRSPEGAPGLIATAYFEFASGRNMTCACLLVPALEATIRNFALALGAITVDAPDGMRRGGYRPLGDILSALEGRMDESWRRFLRSTLVSEHGFNARNNIAHGISLSASAKVASLMLISAFHVCRMLMGIPVEEPSSGP